MCRDDGEPEIGCDCDYCVGYGQGVLEGHEMGRGTPARSQLLYEEVGDFDYEAEVKAFNEETQNDENSMSKM